MQEPKKLCQWVTAPSILESAAVAEAVQFAPAIATSAVDDEEGSVTENLSDGSKNSQTLRFENWSKDEPSKSIRVLYNIEYPGVISTVWPLMIMEIRSIKEEA